MGRGAEEAQKRCAVKVIITEIAFDLRSIQERADAF
jgi:hypothetical protein